MENNATILTFEEFKRFGDSSRFYIQEMNGNIYFFDQHSNGISVLQEELAELYKAKSPEEFKKLVEAMSDEEKEVNEEFVEAILNMENAPPHHPFTRTEVSHLKMNISTACNLNCKYCFKDPTTKRMTNFETMKKAIDYTLFESGKNAAGQSIGLNLTGEPLLELEMIDQIGQYLKKVGKKERRLRNIGFYYITNGTLASDKAIKVIKKSRNEPYVHISIDGPKEVHDAMRVHHDGKGSYDEILANMKRFKKKGFGLKAEGVLTKAFPHPKEVVLHLLEIGFDKVNLKPVRQGTPYSFTMDDLPQIKEGYKEYFRLLTEELLDNQFFLFRALNGDYAMKFLPRILFQLKLKLRCFWGVYNYSMDAKGDFYPCDAVMGLEEFKVGNVETGLDWEKFHRDLDCEKRGDCKNCWARHVCGGTCYANSIYQGKDIMAIDPLECELNKFLIEENLKMLFRLMEGRMDLNMLRGLLNT